MDRIRSLKTEQRQVFLLKLVSGQKSFYQYRSDDEKILFYIDSENGLELLGYKKYMLLVGDDQRSTITAEEGVEKIAENKQYIGQLLVYLSDCPEIQRSIQAARYTKSSLLKVFKKYAECSNEEAVIVEKQEAGINNELNFIAGLTFSTVAFESIHFPEMAIEKFSPSVFPTFGISYDIFLSRMDRSWDFNTDIVYSGYRFKKSVRVEDTNYDIKFGTHFIHFKPMLRKRIALKSNETTLFFNAGPSIGVALAVTNEKDGGDSFSIIKDDQALSHYYSVEAAFNLGVGIEKEKAAIEFRFERVPSLSNNPHLESRLNRWSLTYRAKL